MNRDPARVECIPPRKQVFHPCRSRTTKTDFHISHQKHPETNRQVSVCHANIFLREQVCSVCSADMFYSEKMFRGSYECYNWAPTRATVLHYSSAQCRGCESNPRSGQTFVHQGCVNAAVEMRVSGDGGGWGGGRWYYPASFIPRGTATRQLPIKRYNG